MKTKKNENLKLPVNAIILTEDEMLEIDGGSVSVKMNTNFLTKSFCQSYAQGLLYKGKVRNMTQLQVAQELFAHAQIAFRTAVVHSLGIQNSIINTLISKGAVADIADGGDTVVRRAAFSVIWYGLAG